MRQGYAFGDTEQAATRLGVLGDVFVPPTRALLRSLDTNPVVVLDLGCGPGHTSGLLGERFPNATIVGLDVSPAYVDQARRNCPGCRFETADVTALPLPHTAACCTHGSSSRGLGPCRMKVVRGGALWICEPAHGCVG